MAKKKTPSTHASAFAFAVPTPADTEIEAYGFIRERLKDLGWLVKDPTRGKGGQVWTQAQCLTHPEIKRAFGLKRPEYVVKLSEKSIWIIEAKSRRKLLTQAVDEAKDYYAQRINGLDGNLRVVLATGVAGGEEDGYLVRTLVLVENAWHPVTINGQEATGLLSPRDTATLLERGGPDIREFAPSQQTFLQAAERINEILHVGGINKNDRAKTIAALLLSVVESPPNLEASLPVLIGEINARSQHVLTVNAKPEFARHVEIIPPTNHDNHVKYKEALVRTIQELLELNIRSAMNSPTDVLGQFYEVFLKYGNGAKEIGIVLTPRHVTRFAVEAVGVSHQDIVLDPACGTGGFLVAAFDHVRRTCTAAQLDRFKERNLFGIEQESTVAVLAIVNMIFRGDGKHNITEGDCFKKFLLPRITKGYATAVFSNSPPETGGEPVTRVLMNPPFALRNAPEKEYRFVTSSLSKMVDGGILLSLLPMDCMFGTGDEKVWRTHDLLGKNTLLSVVSLPDELFYPAALKQVVAIIIKKGIPHPKRQSVYWARIAHDGHLKIKSKRLMASELIPPRDATDDIPRILESLQSFIARPGSVKVNVPMLCKTAPIDYDDPTLELLPEAYLDSKPLDQRDIELAIDDLLRETASFLIRFRKEDMARTFEQEGQPDSEVYDAED